MLNIKLEQFTIKREDKYNVTLSVSRPKRSSNLHKDVEGYTTEVIGYYGTLQSALESLLNQHVLDSGDVSTVEQLLEVINSGKQLIKEACNE